MTDADLTGQAVSDLETKQKRNLRWSKIASILVAAARPGRSRFSGPDAAPSRHGFERVLERFNAQSGYAQS